MNNEQKFTPPIEPMIENRAPQIPGFDTEYEDQVSFVETMQVTDGVECEVYSFVKNEGRDLGIIKIEPGKKTPLQRVLQGEKTIEGFLAGKGKLTVTKTDGTQKIHVADGTKPIVVTVQIGETMQWEADPDSNLVAFELCFPPYEDGRFENIE